MEYSIKRILSDHYNLANRKKAGHDWFYYYIEKYVTAHGDHKLYQQRLNLY
jgi:hypothetical protein